MWAAARDDRRPFIALLAVLIALAWTALWIWGRSPGGMFHAHPGGGLDAFAGGYFALVFVAGWTVMVVAMMLPTSLPLIALFRAVVRARPNRALLVALLVAGYLVVWTLFGVAVYLGGWGLREAVEQSGWLASHVWVLGAGTVTLAGLYQFTPLKYKCLDRCRSPLAFVTEHWRGRDEGIQAFRLGAHHGLFCVGCCWSLMLLMFAVGAGSLGSMLVLGAVMAVEKNVSWGKKIGRPLGVVLIGCGSTLLLLGAVPALQPSDGSVRVVLAPASEEPGVTGSAVFADVPGGVEVRLDVRGLPEPGATYLAHVHPGSCAGGSTDRGDHAHDQRGEPAGEIEHPLTPVVSGAGGSGTSTTLVEGASVARLFSGGGFYLNVHAENSSGFEGLPGEVACGDLLGRN